MVVLLEMSNPWFFKLLSKGYRRFRNMSLEKLFVTHMQLGTIVNPCVNLHWPIASVHVVQCAVEDAPGNGD